MARQRMAAGQGELDLGLEVTESARQGAGSGRCRSPRRGWGTCSARLSAATRCWGSRTRPAGRLSIYGTDADLDILAASFPDSRRHLLLASGCARHLVAFAQATIVAVVLLS